jgi:uracil-DNA glycosylase family 4
MPFYKKFNECVGCPLYNAPGPVFGEGDPERAKVVYVAQNPAWAEVEQGRPLVGPTGRVFNRQLFEAGVPRSDLFITNAVKCQTEGNRPPTALECSKCGWIVDREIKACRADVVVLAGQISFDRYIGRYSTIHSSYSPTSAITERMGCVEEKDGRKWVATVHPSNIMRTPKLWWKAVDVLRKAYNLAGRELPRLDLRIYPSDEEVKDSVQEIIKAGEFSDDFETAQSFLVEEDDYVGGDSHPTMLGISWRERQAILIRPEQIHLLEPVLFNPTLWRYEHNGAFDNYYMERVFNGRTPTARQFDTMLAHHYLRSYDYKRLKPDCLGTYTTLPYYGRDLAKLNEPLYCCFDVMATIETAHREFELLKEWKLWDVYWKYGQPIIPILEEWRRIGINTDVRKLLMFRKIIQQKIARAELLISKIVGPTFNPNSPKQLAHLFYEVWKLPVQTDKKKTKDGSGFEQRVTTGFEAKKRLIRWIDESPERQEKYKIPKFFLDLTDYLEGEQAKMEVLDRVSPDGRIHAFFKAHGASSFRLASSPNVQNIPKHDVMKWGTSSQNRENPLEEEKATLGSLRSIVIPDNPDEDLLLSVDLDQAQLWIYAVQFKCKKMMEIYEDKAYIYGIIFNKLHEIRKTGRTFFEEGKPRIKLNKKKDVTDSELKHIKAVPLGFLFGRDAEEVAKEYGMPLSEARELRRIWFKEFVPELEQAYEWMVYQATKNGKYVRHRFGNIVWFPSMKRTEIYNSYAQSPEAMLMIGHIIEIDRRLKEQGLDKERTRIILSVHDSLTLNIGKAKLDPSRMIHVYENIVAPVFNRPIPEMDNFIFRHSADVSQMWDWNEISYDRWKQQYFPTDTTSRSSSTGSPREDRQGVEGARREEVPMH